MTRLTLPQIGVTEHNPVRLDGLARPPARSRSIKDRIGTTYARCFGHVRYRRFNSLLLYLSMRGLGYDNWRDHALSGEESFLSNLLPNAKHPVIFDIGAYHGEYARLVRQFNPAAEIYCFEPHPDSFKILQRAAQECGLMTFQLACGSECGQGQLFDSARETGSKRASCYRETVEPRVSDISVHDVEVVSIDEFASARNIKEIELMKVDVEGGELNVLHGAQELIKERRIKAIQFEVGDSYPVRGTWMRDFYDLLNGYSFYRLLPKSLMPLGPYRVPSHERFHFHNVVAFRDRPNRSQV
jgi:FkbM family methyltransferase